jgi:hypothetical protein
MFSVSVLHTCKENRSDQTRNKIRQDVKLSITGRDGESLTDGTGMLGRA